MVDILLKSNVMSERAGAITQQVHHSDYSLGEVAPTNCNKTLTVAIPRRKIVRILKVAASQKRFLRTNSCRFLKMNELEYPQ